MVLQHGAVKPGRIPNILNMLVVQYGNNQMVILTEVSLFVAPLSLPSLSSPDTDRCMHSKCSLRGHGIATQPACQLHVRVPWVQSWEYTYYINYISLSQICWYIIFYNYMYIWYIYMKDGHPVFVEHAVGRPGRSRGVLQGASIIQVEAQGEGRIERCRDGTGTVQNLKGSLGTMGM